MYGGGSLATLSFDPKLGSRSTTISDALFRILYRLLRKVTRPQMRQNGVKRHSRTLSGTCLRLEGRYLLCPLHILVMSASFSFLDVDNESNSNIQIFVDVLSRDIAKQNGDHVLQN